MNGKFPSLLNFPPQPQYFVDGSMGTADVFIDPVNNGTRRRRPSASGAPSSWAACARAATGYYALDVTQPDDIVTSAGPTFGEIAGNKDAPRTA